jgi:hypothetical protein
MKQDVFGFNCDKPPYRFTGVFEGIPRIEVISENWQEYTIGIPELDAMYVYTKCENKNGTWYNRKERVFCQ